MFWLQNRGQSGPGNVVVFFAFWTIGLHRFLGVTPRVKLETR